MSIPDIYLGPPKDAPRPKQTIPEVNPIAYAVAGAYPELVGDEKLFDIAVALATDGANEPEQRA